MNNHLRQVKGGWIADFQLNGKRKQYKAKTKTEANERMARALAASSVPETPVSTFTMKEARQLSIRTRWANKRCLRTSAGYSADVVAFFGETTPLATINAQEVERFRAYCRSKGNTPATINWKCSALQSMLKDAVLYGHLEAVPPMPRRLPMDNTKHRVFSDLEIDSFIQAFKALGRDKEADLFVFLLETGCRFSEAEALTVSRVDLKRGEVRFLKTKNGRPRVVPLTAKAKAAIEPWLPHQLNERAWGIDYRSFQHRFDVVKGLLGLADDKELTIHVCRHSCLSKLAQAGIPLPQIMAWSGHTSLASVARYMHLDVTGLSAAKAALGG